jgi:ABC-2 type transport system permease protein
MNVRAGFVALTSAARRILIDRPGIVANTTIYVVVVSVLGGLWRAAISANGGMIAGYSAAALTWYIATSEAVTIPLNSRMIADIGEDIVSGTVAVELLRPISVAGLRIVDSFGKTLPQSLSFWLRETGASWFLYQKLVFMLGGMLLPIQVLPAALRPRLRFPRWPTLRLVWRRVISSRRSCWSMPCGW